MPKIPPFVEILYGAAIDDVVERRFLARLARDLTARGKQAIVLANFHVGQGRDRRQVDFVVATEHQAVCVEVKGFLTPVSGTVNGPWTLQHPDGRQQPLGRTNPYEQALTARFRVCDTLRATGYAADPKSALAGSLCLFPIPPVGSQIPGSDLKVRIGAYDECLALISSDAAQPLSLDAWRQFARDLGLTSEIGDISVDRQILEDYLLAWRDLRRATRRPFVEPLIEGGETLAQLSGRLTKGEQLHFVGGSGSGKSELLLRLADVQSETGTPTFMLQARDYRGDLGAMLRWSASRSSREAPKRLLQAFDSLGREAILFVDGLNECPEARRADLLAALQAARLRHQLRVVTSGQAQLDMPMTLSGSWIRLRQPDAMQARTIVEAHLSRALADLETPTLEIVATAHDAMILASVIAEMPFVDGRHALYHAFTRLRAGPDAPLGLHDQLADLATTLRTQFVTMLPRAAAERALGGRMGLEAALGSGLLLVDRGQLRFRHDLIADFYAAERVLRTAASAELGREAARPLNGELREFLVGGCATTGEVARVVDAVDDRGLLTACIAGRCGARAAQLLRDRCHDALDDLEERYGRLTLSLPADFQTAEPIGALVVDVAAGTSSVSRGSLMLHMVECAGSGLFERLLRLFGIVDARIEREVARLAATNPNLRLAWGPRGYNAVYGFNIASAAQDLANILEAAQVERSDAVSPELEAHLNAHENHTPGQIYLMVALLRRQIHVPLPLRFDAFLRAAWGLRIHHLRLALGFIVRFRGRELPDSERAQVRETLNGWLSETDAWGNMTVLDALEGVGGLETDFNVDDAVQEFEALLEAPDEISAKACSSAVIRTWDHPLSDIYYEAFYERLAPEMRRQILLHGLNEPEIDAMFLADLLYALGQEPPTNPPPRLAEFCRRPWPHNHSPQDAVRVYALALTLLAKIGSPIAPTDVSALNEVEAAWLHAAPLVYAFNAPTPVREPEMRAAWDELEACGVMAAFDVIYFLQREIALWQTPRVAFEDHFQSGLLRLARQVLADDYVGRSIFDHRSMREGRDQRHRDYALQLIGRFGRRSDMDLLKRWAEHPLHGQHAIAAARTVEAS